MNELATTGSRLVTDYLEGQGIPFQLLEHPRTHSASADARVTHRRPESVGKTVVLFDRTGYVLAIIPASQRLDLRKLRDALGTTRSLQFVNEAEMASEFPEFETGAIPPFGGILPAAEVVDRRLLDEGWIVCGGGDHTHSILIATRDVVAVTGALVADICQD
jgi:Ala-tRNA(Pro) deacylase